MATPPKDGKLIYHLTSLDNLESIFMNGLLSREDVKDFIDVADKEIIEHRKEKKLNNLVPFHFFAGNPFDGKVQLKHPDKKYVFITLERIYAKKNGFKILPKHPLALDDCLLMDYDPGLEKIDWEKMRERDYSDRECKETCMAECLSEIKIDAKNFYAIYVKDEETKELVTKLRDKIIGKNNSIRVYVSNMFLI